MKGKNILMSLMGVMIVLLTISTVGTTFMWYQYMTNAYFLYRGTSIGDSLLFDIGFKSELRLQNCEEYGLSYDEENQIYWANSTLSEDVTSYYLSSNGYATSQINGVTSAKYESNQQFDLYRSPYYLDNYVNEFNTKEKAQKMNYCHFELVFRAKKVSQNDIVNLNNGYIYLKDIKLDGTGNIKNTIRLHIENSDENFIFSPSDYESGKDTVGGLLDLDRDGIYDYDDFYKKEYLYGEIKNDSPIYKDNKTSDGSDTGEFNGSSFEGEHKNGIYPLDLENTEFETSSYLGYKEVVEDRKLITKIDSSSSLAFLKLDIYLEGWDLDFTDRELNHLFKLNLEFDFNEEG